MRTFFLFMALIVSCGWLAEPCQAQTLKQRFQDRHALLDKREVKTGILIHQSPIFLSPRRYDGLNVADSMRLSLDHFGMLYGQFRGATVGQPILPAPSVYLNKIPKPWMKSDTIALALMAIEYDFFRKGAVADGLLEWSDGQVRDVAGRSKSPYQQDTCFAFTALQQKVKGFDWKFTLPEELIFTNLGRNISRVDIDFDDGEGLRSVDIGSTVQVNYGRSGTKTIRIQYQHSGKVINCLTFIEVEEQIVHSGNRYEEADPEIIDLSGMTLNIFSACEDGKLRRPLIVLEGFGGKSNYGNMFEMLEINTTSNGPLKDYLNVEEYDLIWVDYKDAYASILFNTDYFIEVIEWVNARKKADGSGEPNNLIGISMGGMVSKAALLKMHNVLDKDSEVERFFSYDSPLKGANYPIGFQCFVRDLMNEIGEIGASTASLAVALQLLDSGSAKDLITNRVQLNDNTFSLSTTDYDNFQSIINQWAAIRPLNLITRHIAISNGADFGTLQESLPTEMEILFLDIELESIDDDDGAPNNCYDVFMNASAYLATNASALIYHRTIFFDGACGADDDNNSIVFVLPAYLTLDNAPGSTSNIGIPELQAGLASIEGALEAVADVDVFYQEVALSHFMFVPTVSSLDMPAGTSWTTPTPTGGAAVSRWSVSADNTAISGYSGMSEFNQQHVLMVARVADLIFNQIEPVLVSQLPGTLQSGVVYNFGRKADSNAINALETPRSISQNLTIQSGGQLWINKVGTIGLSNAIPPNQNSHQQQFTVSVPKQDCDDEDTSVTINISDGGKLKIGEYDNGVLNTGQLNLGQNSIINVNGHEGMLIDKHSKLLVTTGASVVINSGGILEANELSNISIVGSGTKLHVKAGATLRMIQGAQLTVESGATLQIDAGANIDLWWPETTIHIKAGGNLRINGDFNFVGKGFFQFDEGNVLTFGPSATTFKLHGEEALDHRFIQLNQDATLNIGNRILDLRFGQVNFETGSSIYMDGGAIKLWGVTFKGNNSYNGGGIIINNPRWIDSWKAHFNRLRQGIAIDGFDGSGTSPTDAIKLDYTQFTGCGNGISISNSTVVTISHSNFDGGVGTSSSGDKALTTSDVDQVKFYYNVLHNYPSYKQPIELNNTTSFRMRSGTIENVQTGIFVPCSGAVPNKTNVFLESGAVIQNCTDAIFIAKGGLGQTQQEPDYGLVSMRCSKLINNSMGVRGTDILLDIDGCAGLPSSCMPNTFIIQDTGDDFFDIVYVERDETSVNATNNYWKIGTVTGAPGTANYSLRRASSFSNCAPIGNLTLVSLNTSNALTDPPINCTNTPPDPNPKPYIDVAMFSGTIYQCAIPMNDGQPLAVNYAHARWDYSSDNDQDAYPRYAAMAAIPNAVRNVSSQTCRHDIDVSRVMAYATAPFFASGNNDDRYSQEEDSDQALQVFPNPASESVQVLFGYPNFTVHVYDMLGKQYLSTTMTNGATISVANWPSGLYLITAIAEESEERSTVKLIVN